MKIKRTLSLLLALVLLVGILCGCGNGNSSSYDDDDDDRPSSSRPKEDPTNPPADPETPDKPDAPTPPATPDDPSAPADPEHPTNIIEMSQISEADDFSEGLAFVELKDDNAKTFCINKNGEIVFTLDDKYNCGTFHNGIAFIYKSTYDASYNGNPVVYICDTEGNLTSPADLGVSAFVEACFDRYTQPYDCFFGDYILVIKSTTTFAGSTDELGILNCDLEYVVEPSAELYELFNSHYDTSLCDYYDGYLYLDDRYLNLRTGEQAFDMDTFYESMQLEYQSDMWTYDENRESNTYKDVRDESIKLDLSQYNETLHKAGTFENGTAPLIFRSESATGLQYYFTILGEDGQFKFEPYALPVQAQSIQYFVSCDINTYLIYAKSNTRDGHKSTILIFNETGLISQAKFEFSGMVSGNTISDNVINIKDYSDDSVYLYDLNFQPLF